METTKQLLGRRIKELRKKRAMSQDQLAERIGVDPKHLSRIETGNGYPSLDTLENLAGALNMNLRDFFEFHHLGRDEGIVETITRLLGEMPEEHQRLVLKIVRAIAV